MKFTKMHGAGNDYVYVDAFKEKIADPSALSIALSDRHTGVGSDGLILIAPSKKADFRMIMFNADGSEGSMCGNGILEETVEGVSGFVASMGNPHFVIPVPSTESAPVTTRGPLIEKHPDFPSRVNVEFVEILSKTHVKQRTWERGSGETFACGSGACAVGFTLASKGLTERSVRIDLLGGTLQIDVSPDGRVRMTGPAVEVFSGEYPASAKASAGKPTKGPRRR